MEEPFVCQARELALNTLRLAEEDGAVVDQVGRTEVLPHSHPHKKKLLVRGEHSENLGVLGPHLCHILPTEPLSGLAFQEQGTTSGLEEVPHLSMPRGGKMLFCGRWASELSIFMLSRSDSGVSVVPVGVILGKELSWGGESRGGQSEDLVLDHVNSTR
jgi:hypothetical protein